ncbi:MAG: CCA tRNA nucleotidyltransferase [Bacteroidia bacterium]|nr:HD domain-containing protein [Bacteroidia bacterium]MCZ2276837.1 CCA tRNA nucleotidyltransferase [Bacteroidia bacterium]
MRDILDHPVFTIASEVADELKTDCFVIGGFVRDALLNRPCTDIDLVTTGNGIELAKAVASKLKEASPVTLFKNFGTAMFTYKDYQIEFVGARKESYSRGSRKPKVRAGSIEDDQLRRDFTINTLAVSLNKSRLGELVDPFGGLADLNQKILRTPLNPETTYSDDPLRMMRAIRFASQLGFGIETQSYNAITSCKDRISIVSMERITDELNKIIMTIKPSAGFKMLFDTGLLHLIFPQMAALQGVKYVNGKGHKDNFYHTLKVLDNISEKTDNLWLRWAAILHDIAKPATQRFDLKTGWTFHGHEDKGARMVPAIFKQLRLPLNEKMKYVQKLVLLHLRPIVLVQETVTDSAVRRLLFEAGDDIDDLMILCRADITSKNEDKVRRYHQNFELVKQKLIEIEEKDRIRNWQPPVSGETIMQTFGLKPSREVGIIKDAIREAILEGEISNSFNEAFELMLKKGREIGLKPQT